MFVKDIKSFVIIHGHVGPIEEHEFDHEPNNEEICKCLNDCEFKEKGMYATVEKRFYMLL